ncbi:disulfide bond formation protein B [Jannaschia sp. LMIT008]|uniref:disulfide bond formation protein B n=1 Tax=Jannaschia maritima TaxID=3032585 RepID=UPI002810C0C3|nr:disulfide bond formation protein B [Jannaschia sp. LMIT008]
MTRWIVLATGGHVALLGGAYLFQLAGYAPCTMCLWQRWPHAVAIVLGVIALAGPAPRIAAGLGALAALTTFGIGFYHAGVEQGWWPGPSSCSGGGSLSDLSADALLSTEVSDTVVMCDDIVWQLGLTMAGWNGVLSLGLAAIWTIAVTRGARMRLSAG